MKTSENRNFKYLTLTSVIFVSVLLISNIAAQKLVPVGPFVFTAGIFLFPISYIFGDILTEVYGYRNTRKIIWLGFFVSLFMAGFFYLIIELPPAPGWENQEAFATTLSQVPRVVLASLLAYLAGEFVNSYIMSALKVKMKGKKLWYRTIGSTIGGQFFDTIIFAVVAFYGIIPNDVLFTAIWSGYLFKVFYEAIATPLTIVIVKFFKSKEGVDIFDDGVNYNPFKA